MEELILQNVLIFLASVDLNFVVYFPLTNFLLQVYMSYLQIYQEKIYDLLNTNSKVDLVLREDPKKGTYKMYQISVEYDIYHSTVDISRHPHWASQEKTSERNEPRYFILMTCHCRDLGSLGPGSAVGKKDKIWVNLLID